MYRRRRHDSRHALALELCRIADDYDTFSGFHHIAVHARLENVWRCGADVDVETVNTQEQYIGVHLAQDIFGEGTDKREGVLSQGSSGKDYFEVGGCEFRSYVHAVRNDREGVELLQCACDC